MQVLLQVLKPVLSSLQIKQALKQVFRHSFKSLSNPVSKPLSKLVGKPVSKRLVGPMLAPKRASGFTLIEVITVIVILGVLASAVASFTRFSTQIYSEASDREQLISSTRFAIERLTREVRNALPNSLRVSANASNIANACLEFVPIIDSTIYNNIAIAPQVASSTIEIIDTVIPSFLSTVTNVGSLSVVIYPLNASDGYSGSSKLFGIDAFTSSNSTINLDSAVQFTEGSPVKRLYVVDTSKSVKYCVEATQLKRQTAGNSVLMAENISSLVFTVANTTLERNAMVQILFTLDKNNEQVVFNHEVQVLNVP